MPDRADYVSEEEWAAVAGKGSQKPARRQDQDKEKPPRFTLTRFADIKRYCVKGFLPRSGLAVVWGPPKCGKSFWACPGAGTRRSAPFLAQARAR